MHVNDEDLAGIPPYYQHGGVTIYLGDCLEVMPHLSKVDLVLTDPPYGTTDCKWDTAIPLDKMWAALKGITHDKTPIVLCCGEPFTSVLVVSNLKQFKYRWVWEKNLKTGPYLAKQQPMLGHEDIAVFYKSLPAYNPQKRARTSETKNGNKRNSKTSVYGGAWKEKYTDQQSNLIHPDTVLRDIKCVHSSSGRVHPTQKPVALMEYMIKTYTNPGDTVLDFAMGSGTTLVAARNLGRKAIGIEFEEKYCAIAVDRLKQGALLQCS